MASGRPPGDEIAHQRVSLFGKLDLRHVTALGQNHLRRPGQRSGDVTGEARRHHPVLLAPDKKGRRSQPLEAGPEPPAAERLLEVDLSRGGVEGDPGRG